MSKNDKVRVVRKYLNRRLYDTATSCYIVQDDIKQMIMDGEKVQVIEVKTDKDITKEVLLQIILEQEANGNGETFSQDFLTQIIYFYGTASKEVVGKFLEEGLGTYRKLQNEFYSQMKSHYNVDKFPSEIWNNFMQSRLNEFENMMKNYLENSTEVFTNLQEQFQNQTQQIFDYMEQFPFGFRKKK